MQDYRFYSVDGTGHIDHAEWIQAPTVDKAIQKAGEMRPYGHESELWLGVQLVAKISLTGRVQRLPVAGASGSQRLA